VTHALAAEIMAGRGEGETARSLRAEFDAITARSSVYPDAVRWAVNEELNNRLWNYVRAVEDGTAQPADLSALREQWARGAPYASQFMGTLSEQVRNALEDRMSGASRELITERHAPAPNRDRLASLEKGLTSMAAASGLSAEQYIAQREEWYRSDPHLHLRDELIIELRKDNPDPKRLARLERAFVRDNYDKEWGEARLERIATAVELDKLDRFENPTDVQKARRDEVARRYEELRARFGDPLIQIEAPKDAQQVIALMPDGTVKPLAWNAASGRWEARFDIPAWAAEGTYAVTVVVVAKDGARRTLTVRYHVDLTAPAARALAAAQGSTLRLDLEADADTARASALLPWGEEVALRPSATPGKFFALAQVPAEWRGKALTVTYILTDAAHNRTQVVVSAE
jgi:hypothetical protein